MPVNASLSIEIASHNRSSFLKRVYAEPPFKVADITEKRNGQVLELMLMSASPGILDEDRYHFKLELKESSSLKLTTQSYQRLFSMKKGAVQNMDVHMAGHSSFVYLPHPVVPHESAMFTATNKIYLDESCNLIWAEIMTCGRKLNGERFLFSFYRSLTEIFFGSKRVVRENLLMAPGKMDIDVIGQLEGFTHQASLIWLSPAYESSEQKEMVRSYLSEQTGILFGVTNAPVKGLIIRLLGSHAAQLFDCLKNVADMLTIKERKLLL